MTTYLLPMLFRYVLPVEMDMAPLKKLDLIILKNFI